MDTEEVNLKQEAEEDEKMDEADGDAKKSSNEKSTKNGSGKASLKEETDDDVSIKEEIIDENESTSKDNDDERGDTPVANGNHAKDGELEDGGTEQSKEEIETPGKKRGRKSAARAIEDTSIKVPDGWRRELVQRISGASAGKMDVYYYSPLGKKLRSKVDVKNYCIKNNIEINIDDFLFSQPKGLSVGTPKTTTPKAARTPKAVKTPKTESPKKRKTKDEGKSESAKKIKADDDGKSPPAKKINRNNDGKSPAKKIEANDNDKSHSAKKMKANSNGKSQSQKKEKTEEKKGRGVKGVGATKAKNSKDPKVKMFMKFPFGSRKMGTS